MESAPNLLLKLGVKVIPNASHDEIVGWLGDDLKIRVQTPPEDGRANKRVCYLISMGLGVPKNAMSIISGHAAQRKIIEIAGICQEDVEKKFPKRQKS